MDLCTHLFARVHARMCFASVYVGAVTSQETVGEIKISLHI